MFDYLFCFCYLNEIWFYTVLLGPSGAQEIILRTFTGQILRFLEQYTMKRMWICKIGNLKFIGVSILLTAFTIFILFIDFRCKYCKITQQYLTEGLAATQYSICSLILTFTQWNGAFRKLVDQHVRFIHPKVCLKKNKNKSSF